MDGEQQENSGIFVDGFVIGGLLGAAVALIIGARLARARRQSRQATVSLNGNSGAITRSGSYFGDEQPADSRDDVETPRIVLDRGNGSNGLANGDSPSR